MKILIKYLKPYTLLLLVAITLLFVQAYTNLALPDYMSDIVNIGIQQGGIIDAVPLVVRESTMERLLLFIDDNGKSKVLENYRVVEPGSDEVSVYGEDFPGVVKESVYFFVDGDSDTRKILNSLLGRSWLALKASEGYGGKISGAPESMSLTMVNQAAVRLVREEYRALGMNTRRIQMDSIVHTGILMLLFASHRVMPGISVWRCLNMLRISVPVSLTGFPQLLLLHGQQTMSCSCRPLWLCW